MNEHLCCPLSKHPRTTYNVERGRVESRACCVCSFSYFMWLLWMHIMLKTPWRRRKADIPENSLATLSSLKLYRVAAILFHVYMEGKVREKKHISFFGTESWLQCHILCDTVEKMLEKDENHQQAVHVFSLPKVMKQSMFHIPGTWNALVIWNTGLQWGSTSLVTPVSSRVSENFHSGCILAKPFSNSSKYFL